MGRNKLTDKNRYTVTTFPSPLDVLTLAKGQAGFAGIMHTLARVWIKPRMSWDGEGRRLAWYFSAIYREDGSLSSGKLHIAEGYVYSGPKGIELSLPDVDLRDEFDTIEAAEAKFPHPRNEGWHLLDADIRKECPDHPEEDDEEGGA